MADAPKKTRKAQGPRTAKPIYILVRAKDENGNPIALTPERVEVTAVKDPVEVVNMFAKGGMEGVAFVQFTPAPASRPASAPTA